MVKAYYNYELSQSFGAVLPAVVPVPIVFVAGKRRCVLAAANEFVQILSLKSQQLLHTIDPPSKGSLASVTALHYGEKSRQVFAGYSNGDVQVYDLATNTQTAVFSSKEKPINFLSLIESNLSDFLLAGCVDNTLLVYDLQMGELVYTVKDASAQLIQALPTHGKTKLVTVAADGILRFYHFSNCVLEHSIPTGKADLSGAKLISVGKEKGAERELLVVSCSDDELLLMDLSLPYDARTFSVLKRPSFHKVVQMELLDGLLVLLTDNHHAECYWVLDEKEAQKKFKRKQKRNVKDLTSLEAYLADPKSFFALEVDLKLADNCKRVALLEVLPENAGVKLIAFTGKNSYLTPTIHFTDKKVELGSLVQGLGHGHPILFTAISSDDFYLVSGSIDCVCLWELQNGRLVRQFDIDNATTAIFLPSDRFLALSTSTGLIQLVDLNTHEVASTFSISRDTQDGPQSSKSALAITDMCLNASPKANRLDLFAISSNGFLHSFTIGSRDGQVFLRQTLNQRLDDEPTRLRFSHNGAFAFVSFLNNSIKMYHSDTFKEVLSMYGHVLPVSDFDMSTDDYVLASISLDKTIRIWDKDFGNCRKIINKVHENGGLRLKIVRDTHYALTSGKDGLVKLWDLDSFELVQIFESTLGADVRALSLARGGQFFVAGGSGRILRKFEQTKEQIFTSDVQEKLQEEAFVYEDLKKDDKEMPKESVVKRYEVVKSAEDLMDFIDEVERTFGEKQREYELDRVALSKRQRPAFEEGDAERKNPAELVLGRLEKIPKPELGPVLDYVHFRHIEHLVFYINYAVENGIFPNLCFVLLQGILDRQQQNLLQNKTAMRVLARTVDNMIGGFQGSLRTSTFNMAALGINLQEAKLISFK